MDKVLPGSITVIVMDRRQRTVDGELLKVGTTVTVELGIKVRKDTSLQQRIFGKVDTANNVARLELSGLAKLLGDLFDMFTHHDLLSLSEIVDWVCVQLHNTNRLERN